MVPGECLIFRDFVNQYTPDGKMINLVLVVMWRSAPNEELSVLKLNHFCSDEQTNSASAYFVADVFEYHLGANSRGFFNQYVLLLCLD